MAIIFPYVTGKFTAYEGDKITTTLSLAVRLNDDYTKEQPFGNIKVKIKEGDIKAVRNLSGYYLFTDLAAGNYNVVIESDVYFPEERPVDTLEFDTTGPASGDTSAKLKDVSKLQKDDVVEFHNPAGERERKSVTNIDVGTKTISWTGGLEHNFSVAGSTVRVLVVEIALKPKPSYRFPSSATLARGLVSNTGPVVNADVTVVAKTIETLTDEKGEFVLYFKGIKQEVITVEIKKGGNTKSVNTTVEEGKTKSLGIISFP